MKGKEEPTPHVCGNNRRLIGAAIFHFGLCQLFHYTHRAFQEGDNSIQE
jgi:hypothetical protein